MPNKSLLFITKDFLPYSNTFTYVLLNNLKKYIPVIFCESKSNSDLFPIKWDCFFYNKNWSLVREWSIQNYINDVVKNNKIDIIHCNTLVYWIYAFKAVKNNHLPVTVHCRGMDVYGFEKDRYFKYRVKKYDKYVSSYICVSKHLKDFLVEKYGINSSKVYVCYGGIDLAKFKKNNKYDRNGVLMVGRPSEKKGYKYGFEAFKMLLKDYPDMMLTIVGPTNEDKHIMSLLDEYDLFSNVCIYGIADSIEVADLMSKSKILLAPHVTAQNGDREGIPNVIKEAMASGLPVVSTYHAGIPEIINHTENGLLCEEKHACDLYCEMLKLLRDNNLYDSIAIGGRKKVEKYFDIVKQNIKFEEILDRAFR